MSDQLIPTFAMTNDPRLRRLFALVGIALDECVHDALYDALLTLAPEYLPPDDTDDSALRAGWEALVAEEVSR